MELSSLIVVHQLTNLTYIYVDRAVSDTSSASGALDAVIIFVHIVLQLVHETLAHTLKLVVSRVMT